MLKMPTQRTDHKQLASDVPKIPLIHGSIFAQKSNTLHVRSGPKGRRMHYIFSEGGLSNELSCISDIEAIEHLRNHLGNFLLDTSTCAAYAKRLGTIPQDHCTESVREWTRYLLSKFGKLAPLNERLVPFWTSATELMPNYLRDLSKCRPPDNVLDWLDNASWTSPPEKVRTRLLEFLKAYPYAPQIHMRLLEDDLRLDIPAGSQWQDRIRLPPTLKTTLDWALLEAWHLQGDNERALETLSKLPKIPENEYWLNIAGEIHARNGNHGQAVDMYTASLRLDPNQRPAHFRINELLNPFRPDPSTLSSRTAIFLYSWNKSELLKNTLMNLAKSETGNASITVLLNGCTDDSKDMVDNINRTCFSDSIQLIELPINIGAPAARNWLLATREGREAEFVAFLDDDVDVPPNWLASLLTSLRDNPGSGVVGAKILTPGSPPRLQYLFRNISVARNGMIRLSLATPDRNFDSGIYNFVRETDNVMGCCHVFTRAALDAVSHFDIRFSPSQMDDISHDIDLRIKGFKVIYCGLVHCYHHQMSGVGLNTPASLMREGNVIGNDVKFVYKYIHHIDSLKKMNNLYSQ